MTLRQVRDFGGPVVHLGVDVRSPLAFPRRAETLVPYPLQVRWLRARPRARDQQVSAELEIQLDELRVVLLGESPDAFIPNNPLKEKLEEIAREPQLFWYDHPIPIGVAPEENEVIYGLKGLEDAFEFESLRGDFSIIPK